MARRKRLGGSGEVRLGNLDNLRLGAANIKGFRLKERLVSAKIIGIKDLEEVRVGKDLKD